MVSPLSLATGNSRSVESPSEQALWPCVDGTPLASGFLMLLRSAGWCGHVFGL